MNTDCKYCSHHFNVQDNKMPDKCTLSQGKPCTACERQAELHKRIEETKKLLDALIIEEREARTDINAHHDPLQIYGLPVEITSYIFRLTLPPFTLQKPSFFNDFPSEEIYCSLEALTLGAVCRAWRQAAWSEPQLWTNIMLTLHREPSPNKMAVAKEWLERSKTLPLNIRLFLVDNDELLEKLDGYLDPDVFRHTLRPFASLFNDHSARWSTFSVQSPIEISQYFHGNQDGAPSLRELQVLNFPNQTGRFQLQGAIPEPARIDMVGYIRLHDLAISWKNVTHATLDDFLLDQYVALIQNAPKLVKLCLKYLRFSDGLRRFPKPATPPIQHDLQILDIWVSYGYTGANPAGRIYRVIFDSVTLPCLTELTFDGPESVSFNTIKHLLERSSPPLIGLAIRTKCDQQEALDLLYSLPSSLNHLNLDLRATNGTDLNLDNLFDHLTYAPNVADEMPSRRELLPNLVTFKWFLATVVPYPIPWNRLPHLQRPHSGRHQRPLKNISFYLRGARERDSPLLFLDKGCTDIDEGAVRGLIGLLEDGIELYLPGKASREDLLSVLVEML